MLMMPGGVLLSRSSIAVDTARLLGIVLVAVVIAATPARAVTLTAQQITPSGDASNQSWSPRNSSTKDGKIVFVRTTNDGVYLFNGTTVQSVQPTIPGNLVETSVMMLGSGSTAGEVLAGWRRGAGKGYVSINGGTAQPVNLNPEHVSLINGCAFMVFQTAADGNRAFKINTADGSTTALSSDTAAANNGAFRVFASGCTKAVVGWQIGNSTGPIILKYWDGTTSTDVDSGVDQINCSFVNGKLVYVKKVGGIDQVFLIDTNTSLSPVQLTTETDPTATLRRPLTDGRHVAWYRTDASGSRIVFNGGVAFPTGPLGQIDANSFLFLLDRGQLLWTNANLAPRTFFYDDGRETFTIDPSPATDIIRPWLTDGYVVFLGPTATSGADNEVFRVTGTAPADASQPAAPLVVLPTAGTTQVRWDSILGATSYNAYVAYAPGVTKDNYASLPGGRKITGVTSGFSITGVPVNTTYYVAISAMEGATEGPSSRVGTTTLLGNMTWQSVGSLAGTTFYSVAADQANPSFVYAGANGAVYKSSNGGINWTQVLPNATTAATRVAALAVNGGRVLANMMSQADIWRSPDYGVNWTRILEVSGFGESNGSLAVDPVNTNTMYAGDFILPGMAASDSFVIKSTNGGTNWTHTAEGPGLGDEIHAYAMAIDPTTPSILYAGGSGTPNIARSTTGGTTWTDTPIPGNTGGVYSLAIDPANTSIVYASTRDQGIFKSTNSGGIWTAKNSGLSGVGVIGTGFNSILADPQNSNLLHLGAGNGYWFSLDGGENWSAANNGFGGSPPLIFGLAMTPGRRLIAATNTGLYMLSFAQPPEVSSVSPNSGHIGGGAVVTITGSAFQTGATVTLGGTNATGVNVISATTIQATTAAHGAGIVAVVVTNPDFQSGTLAGSFTYASSPDIPTGVLATAQTTTSVHVVWNAAAGATSYQIFRRAPGGGFTPLNTTTAPTTTFDDPTVTPNTAYAYRVRASNGSGVSGDSATDIATTILFANDPLTTGVVVQALHVTQLRSAIDAVRQLVPLGAAGYTNAAVPGVIVRGTHVTEMRSALDPALTALGMAAGGYTDSVLSGVPIKAVHLQEVRNRIK
ncbi:MAG: IPT/TIG domain-containing protein [Acidobacteriota bacterium]